MECRFKVTFNDKVNGEQVLGEGAITTAEYDAKLLDNNEISVKEFAHRAAARQKKEEQREEYMRSLTAKARAAWGGDVSSIVPTTTRKPVPAFVVRFVAAYTHGKPRTWQTPYFDEEAAASGVEMLHGILEMLKVPFTSVFYVSLEAPDDRKCEMVYSASSTSDLVVGTSEPDKPLSGTNALEHVYELDIVTEWNCWERTTLAKFRANPTGALTALRDIWKALDSIAAPFSKVAYRMIESHPEWAGESKHEPLELEMSGNCPPAVPRGNVPSRLTRDTFEVRVLNGQVDGYEESAGLLDTPPEPAPEQDLTVPEVKHEIEL